MVFIITEPVYICLGASWKTPPGARISRCINWRPVGDLLLLSALWSGCCLFGTFPISILNFIDSTSNVFWLVICLDSYMINLVWSWFFLFWTFTNVFLVWRFHRNKIRSSFPAFRHLLYNAEFTRNSNYFNSHSKHFTSGSSNSNCNARQIRYTVQTTLPFNSY